jgi:hypothetical protein
MAKVKVNDQNTRAITSQNKTEIECKYPATFAPHGHGTIETKKSKRRNAEQQGAMQFAGQDISQGANPLERNNRFGAILPINLTHKAHGANS